MPPCSPPPPLASLATWLAPLLAHCGDRRTARTLTGVVGGILGSGGLVCTRIAAFSPSAGSHPPCRPPDSPHADR